MKIGIAQAGRALPWILVVAGVIGLLASADLTVEKMRLLADPDYRPSCSINPILSCGSVMMKPQAQVFGFANSLLGVVGFTVTTTVGMALLAGGAFRRWFWWGLQLGVLFGIGFVHWLIWQSVVEIRTLCPYCMVVWVVMIPTFVYVTLANLTDGAILRRTSGVWASLRRYAWVIVAVWYVVILAVILVRFPNVLSV